MAQLDPKERVFTEELYQRYNDKCDRSLIPKDKLEEIKQRLNIMRSSDDSHKKTREDYYYLERYFSEILTYILQF